MSKTFLLGAGASVGYTDSKPWELRPPGSEYFFLRGRNIGILDRNIFPDLCEKVDEYVSGNQRFEDLPPERLKFDIERFLRSLGDEFTESDRGDDGQKAHAALGQSFYYIYELFRHYQKLYRPENDNYHRLALHRHDSKYNVISLNYDTLLEEAFSKENIPIRYGFGDGYPPQSIKFAKPHGSINWIRRFREGALALGNSEKLSDIASYIFSNQIKGGNIANLKVLPVEATETIEHRDLIRSNSSFDHPAIVPPVGGYKHYDRVDEYQTVHNFTNSILSDTTELVIIGSSIRKEDEFLISTLDEHLDPDIDIQVICLQDTEEVADRMRVICEDASIDTSIKDFTSYTRTI